MFDFVVFGPMILGLSLWPSVFFWLLVAAIFVELCFDNGIAALVTLVVAAGAAYWLGFWGLDFVYQYHRAFLWLLAFYVPSGILWSTIKWWLYCNGVAAKVRKFLADQETSIRRQRDMTDEWFEQKMGEVRNNLWQTFEPLPPYVSRHKSDLMRWMAWWPFSIVSSIFDDMLRRLFTALYNACAEVWQRISNHAFRGIQIKNPDPAVKKPV